MKKERINRIEIDWRGLFKPIHGLRTGPDDDPLINDIVVKQEIIPIIFVPGSMGSRLKYPTGGEKQKDEKPERAWDPDSKLFMLLNYGRLCLDPEDRKLKMIGNQSHDSNYLDVDNENKKHNKKLPSGMDKHGWGSVFWESYGKILKALDTHFWPEPLHACFHFPVYAFGYNWTNCCSESGKQLAAFINETIKENAKLSECTQVILVTHSMGGLVARAACNPKNENNVKDKVLGVVHGVQPVTGAPAAYFRMKTGFEPPGSPTGKFWDWLCNPLKLPWTKFKGTMANYVLGDSGQDVTVLMANSPGALELLPNKLYKDNSGSAQWLRYTDIEGGQTNLPNSDPYAEIYSNRGSVYRLIDPEWLGNQSNEGYEQKVYSAWSDYKKNLNKAEAFHESLQDTPHPETYQLYATGIDTADRVEITARRELITGALALDTLDKKQFIMEVRDECDEKMGIDDFGMKATLTGKTGIVYALKPPSGSGDSTVPDSSGKALKAKASSYNAIAADTTVDINNDDESWFDRQHDKIYNTKTAQNITLKAIENLCKHKIKKETGAA